MYEALQIKVIKRKEGEDFNLGELKERIDAGWGVVVARFRRDYNLVVDIVDGRRFQRTKRDFRYCRCDGDFSDSEPWIKIILA